MGVLNSTARRSEFPTGRRTQANNAHSSKVRRAAALGPIRRPVRPSGYAARLPRQNVRTRVGEEPFPMVADDVLDPAFDEFGNLAGHVDGLAAHLRADRGRSGAWEGDPDA